MKENNKILREFYEDHFIKKFKQELNRRPTSILDYSLIKNSIQQKRAGADLVS